mgnify:CR=1 FL=1
MNKDAHNVNKPVAVKIIENNKENEKIRTLIFDLDNIKPRSGQFFMVWIPGVDEIPMSISSIDNDSGRYSITVAAVGEATKALCEKKKDDFIGIRGPFGNGFSLPSKEKKVSVIGGGVGFACVHPLISEVKKNGNELHVINAARTESELLFHDKYLDEYEFGKNYFTSTDDGTCGEKCFGHELLLKLLSEENMDIDIIYTCGPELMMKQILNVCNEKEIDLQASLERMMRCGNGICGLCSLDPQGWMVCKDGPVFSGTQLNQVTEFGRYHRDLSGTKKHF